MPSYKCKCGAKYKLPDTSIGKKAKCKHCNLVFVVKDEKSVAAKQVESDPDDLFADIEAAVSRSHKETATERVTVDPYAAMTAAYGPAVATATAAKPARATPTVSPSSGYASALLRALQFPFANVNNLIIFIFLFLLICFRDVLLTFAGPFGTAGRFIITGWFCAFRFDVLGESAAGREDLPSMGFTNGFVDDVIIPFFSWIGSWVAALLPAIIFALFTLFSGSESGWEYVGSLAGGLAVLLSQVSGEQNTFMILIYVGIFLWPMIALCISLGGFVTLSRVDLILLTIIKTLPAYLLTAGIVVGTFVTSTLLMEHIFGTVMKTATAGGGFNFSKFMAGVLVWQVFASLITCYFEIVSVRCIGLYYYYQRHRFAWDWG